MNSKDYQHDFLPEQFPAPKPKPKDPAPELTDQDAAAEPTPDDPLHWRIWAECRRGKVWFNMGSYFQRLVMATYPVSNWEALTEESVDNLVHFVRVNSPWLVDMQKLDDALKQRRFDEIREQLIIIWMDASGADQDLSEYWNPSQPAIEQLRTWIFERRLWEEQAVWVQTRGSQIVEDRPSLAGPIDAYLRNHRERKPDVKPRDDTTDERSQDSDRVEDAPGLSS